MSADTTRRRLNRGWTTGHPALSHQCPPPSNGVEPSDGNAGTDGGVVTGPNAAPGSGVGAS